MIFLTKVLHIAINLDYLLMWKIGIIIMPTPWSHALVLGTAIVCYSPDICSLYCYSPSRPRFVNFPNTFVNEYIKSIRCLPAVAIIWSGQLRRRRHPLVRYISLQEVFHELVSRGKEHSAHKVSHDK
jgi:hypothetical protein